MIFTTNKKKAKLVDIKTLKVLETRTSKDGFSKEEMDGLNQGETRGKWIFG